MTTLCAVRFFLGIECPGCGLTRSMLSLIRGDFSESIQFHPMGILIALVAIYLTVRALGNLFFDFRMKPLLGDKAKMIVTAGFLVGLFGQWCVRILL